MAPKSVEVTVVRCEGLPRVQLLGRQDPYVIITYMGQESRSRVSEDGGTNPQFNEKFVFALTGDSTVLKLSIENGDRRGQHIGNAKADFVMALETGKLQNAFPVFNSDGEPHGSIELVFEVPEVLAARDSQQKMEAMSLADANDRWSKAIAEARARYAPEVEAGLAPLLDALAPLEKEHWEVVTEVKEGHLEEVEEIIREPITKVQGLMAEAVKELNECAVGFTDEFPKATAEKSPGANTKFAREIDTLQHLIAEANDKRAKDLQVAEQILTDGLKQTLARFHTALSSLYEDYEAGFKRAVARYQTETKAHLQSEAEAKAVADATSIAGPPPPGTVAAPSVPQPQYAAAAPAAAAPAPAVTVEAPSVPQPQYVAPAPAPPVPAAAYPAYTPPPYYGQPPYPPQYGAPPPQPAYGGGNSYSTGYPMTQSEQASAEAARAQAEAAASNEAARKAEADAAAMRYQQQQQQQRAEMAMVMGIRERRAVRRGLVGGMVLANALN